jgi:hypothetical protein
MTQITLNEHEANFLVHAMQYLSIRQQAYIQQITSIDANELYTKLVTAAEELQCGGI